LDLSLETLFLLDAISEMLVFAVLYADCGEGRTLEARGVISTLISLPSSSWRGLKIAVVCWRLLEDVNVRLTA
jgi:hypothetical protein